MRSEMGWYSAKGRRWWCSNRRRVLSGGACGPSPLLGYGTSSDAHHITAPSQAGQVAAMRNCLADAGFAAEQVDYLNLHGTATKANDETEAAAVVEVFGPHSARMPASSTKSMLGHALGASGAIEFVICIAAMQNQFVPPTINCDEPIQTSGSTMCRTSAGRIPFVPPCRIRSLLAATMRVFSWGRANDRRRSRRIIEELKPALVRASNGRAKLDQIDESALIIEDIGLASLDLLELRFELEERWKTRITDEEAIRLKRIHDVVDLTVGKRQQIDSCSAARSRAVARPYARASLGL